MSESANQREAPERMEEVKKNHNNTNGYCYQCKNETRQKILFEQGEMIQEFMAQT